MAGNDESGLSAKQMEVQQKKRVRLEQTIRTLQIELGLEVEE